MAQSISANVSRDAIEKLVRESVYRQLGLQTPSSSQGSSSLLVNMSARHCHLTQEAVEILFGKGHQLTPMKWLYQEGQYAAEESVTLVGPRSRVISNLRILGPCRTLNQVELSYTDAMAMGYKIPLRFSGDIAGTPGCMLMGPKGFLELEEGVIRAAPHVHMSPADADAYGVKHGDYMKLRVGGDLATVFEKIYVRVSPDFKLEVHIDTDEGNTCGLLPETPVELVK